MIQFCEWKRVVEPGERDIYGVLEFLFVGMKSEEKEQNV